MLQKALLRTCKLAKFGHFLTTIPETGITYDENTKMFNITPDPPIEEEGNGELENGDYKDEWVSSTVSSALIVAWVVLYFKGFNY